MLSRHRSPRSKLEESLIVSSQDKDGLVAATGFPPTGRVLRIGAQRRAHRGNNGSVDVPCRVRFFVSADECLILVWRVDQQWCADLDEGVALRTCWESAGAPP